MRIIAEAKSEQEVLACVQKNATEETIRKSIIEEAGPRPNHLCGCNCSC